MLLRCGDSARFSDQAFDVQCSSPLKTDSTRGRRDQRSNPDHRAAGARLENDSGYDVFDHFDVDPEHIATGFIPGFGATRGVL